MDKIYFYSNIIGLSVSNYFNQSQKKREKLQNKKRINCTLLIIISHCTAINFVKKKSILRMNDQTFYNFSNIVSSLTNTFSTDNTRIIYSIALLKIVVEASSELYCHNDVL